MLNKFIKGLHRTREAIKNKFDYLFVNSEINEEFFDELEEILVTADVGVETTVKIINSLKERLKEARIRERSSAREILKKLLVDILDSDERSELSLASTPPTVFLVLGVNGVGKTTTIAKMAYKFTREGRKCCWRPAIPSVPLLLKQLDEWSEIVGRE